MSQHLKVAAELTTHSYSLPMLVTPRTGIGSFSVWTSENTSLVMVSPENKKLNSTNANLQGRKLLGFHGVRSRYRKDLSWVRTLDKSDALRTVQERWPVHPDWNPAGWSILWYMHHERPRALHLQYPPLHPQMSQCSMDSILHGYHEVITGSREYNLKIFLNITQLTVKIVSIERLQDH